MTLIDLDTLCAKLRGGTIIVEKEFILSQLDTESFARFVTENCPTIDPVKHGRWKEITYHNGCTPDYDCVCSECGTSGVPYYEYCPGCGARMDADE